MWHRLAGLTNAKFALSTKQSPNCAERQYKVIRRPVQFTANGLDLDLALIFIQRSAELCCRFSRAVMIPVIGRTGIKNRRRIWH